MSSKDREQGLILYQPGQVTIQEEKIIDAISVNRYADPNSVLQGYKRKIRSNTMKNHIYDLAVFCRFLQEKDGKERKGQDLEGDLYCWLDIPLSAPLLEEYCLWMQDDSFSVGSIKVRLDTVRIYCKLLAKAGLLDTGSYAALKLAEGIKKKDRRTVDQNRNASGIATRKSDARKAGWVELTTEQLNTLLKGIGTKTPLARRDNLFVRLAWLHALRVSEAVCLTIDQVDQQTGILNFDRPKTFLYNQRLRFSPATMRIMRAYIQDRLAETTLKTNIPLFPSWKSRKEGEPPEERAMIPQIASRRVATLARQHLGIEQVSFHDGRHKWAGDVLSNPKMSLKDAMEGGGWKTPYMPMEYAERLKISNENIVLPELEVDREESEL